MQSLRNREMGPCDYHIPPVCFLTPTHLFLHTLWPCLFYLFFVFQFLPALSCLLTQLNCNSFPQKPLLLILSNGLTFYSNKHMTWDFHSGSVVKNSPAVQELQETRVSIPGSGRPPGEGNGNLLHCSCLENPMDRGAWQATVHGVTKSWTRLQWLITRVWANFLKCFLFSSEFLLFSSPPVSPHSVSEHKRFL